MSTTPTEPKAPEAVIPAAPAVPEQPATEKAPAQEPDWKAEARKWEQRAKENRGAAEKLAAIEEASKTESERLADQLAKANRDLLSAKREAFAATKGVPAKFVTGETPDEWESSAADAIAWRGSAEKPPAAPSAAGQGNVGKPIGTGAAQLTGDDMKRMYAEKKYDEIAEAQAAGRFNNLLGIS